MVNSLHHVEFKLFDFDLSKHTGEKEVGGVANREFDDDEGRAGETVFVRDELEGLGVVTALEGWEVCK